MQSMTTDSVRLTGLLILDKMFEYVIKPKIHKFVARKKRKNLLILTYIYIIFFFIIMTFALAVHLFLNILVFYLFFAAKILFLYNFKMY